MHRFIYYIVQPVLQWGVTEDGYGVEGWSIANWCVEPAGGQVTYSEESPVTPGTKLTARISLVGQHQNLFNYECTFDEYPQTKLAVTNSPELKLCVVALEAYHLTNRDQYPASDKVALT